MRAMLKALWPELTRPTYSSIRFGGVPAGGTTVGAEMSLGIADQFTAETGLRRKPPWGVSHIMAAPHAAADTRRLLHLRIQHVGGVKEGAFFGADVDEGCLDSGQDGVDATQINVAHHAAGIGSVNQ